MGSIKDINSQIPDYLKLLNRIAAKILSTLEIDRLYSEVLAEVQRELNYHHLSIWTYDERNRESVLKATTDRENYPYPIGYRLSVSLGMIGWCIRHQKTLLANDVEKEQHYYPAKELDTRSAISTPMIFMGSRLLGTLNVESREKEYFGPQDILVVETLAHLFAIALVNAELYEKGKSFNDVLTEKIAEKTQELKQAQIKILEQQQALKKENRALKTLISKHQTLSSRIIGSSKAMKQLLAMVDRIAPTQATVLIQGESGTGKELIAKRLHEKSQRNEYPYVTINCGALQETLLESELFGHEKGSFTGAHMTKNGLVETADGGTLFLDEIGEMGRGMQSKLLRFLQEGEMYRVGGKRPLKVDVRVLSATNKDLEKEVKDGNFREDLYYRLNMITLRVPPLRKRKDDIVELVEYFLSSNEWGNSQPKKISTEALEVLINYDWPGNIRELQNTIERMKILAEGDEITVQDIAYNIQFPQKKNIEVVDFNSIVALEELEKVHILRTLSWYQGNKTKTAQALGITIKTLYNKLSKYENPLMPN